MLLCFLPGCTASLWLPPPAPADPSTQDPLAASWGSQDIHLEKSVLRRVQLGHGNQMSLHDAPAAGPDRSPSIGSPSVSPPGSHPAIPPHPDLPHLAPPRMEGPSARICRQRGMMGNSFPSTGGCTTEWSGGAFRAGARAPSPAAPPGKAQCSHLGRGRAAAGAGLAGAESEGMADGKGI